MLLPLFTACQSRMARQPASNTIVSVEDVAILDEDIVSADIVAVRVEGEVLRFLPVSGGSGSGLPPGCKRHRSGSHLSSVDVNVIKLAKVIIVARQ